MTAYELLSGAKRAPKGSRTATPLQRAIRDRDRVWGDDLVDAMLQVAALWSEDRYRDAGDVVVAIRKTRRFNVMHGAQQLLDIAVVEARRGATA